MKNKNAFVFLLTFTLLFSNVATVFASEVSVLATEAIYENDTAATDDDSNSDIENTEERTGDTKEGISDTNESIEETISHLEKENSIEDETEVNQALTVKTLALHPAYTFVTRLYENALSRNPDPIGLSQWGDQLISRTKTGAEVVAGFIFSPEFINKKLSKGNYINILYKTLLNRSPDSQGYSNWLALLEAGCSRRYVLSQFIASSEFTKLCDTYAITRGSLTLTEPRDTNINATLYVGRLYHSVLGRPYDEDGMNNWAKKLASKSTTGAGIAFSFFNNNEYRKKNTTDEAFITSLYKALLNRSPDAAGKSSWLNMLKTGVSRTYVLKAFCTTAEFQKICSSCGISLGSISTTEARDQNKDITFFILNTYKNCLGRTPGGNELNQWAKQLNSGTLPIDSFLYAVIFSPEGSSKYSTNEQFIKTLYQTVLQRGADSTGLSAYSNQLATGKSKSEIFYELIASGEFANVCKKYNISFSYNGWRQLGNGWCYYKNGRALSGWSRIDGNRYYLNPSNGNKRATGWNYVDGYKYYFNNQGVLMQDIRSVIGAQSSYQIKVNRQMNCITVYTRDTNGSYIIPVVSFITSTGRNNKTPLGTYSSRKLGVWWTLLGPSYGQYVTQIYGGYLFHSVPYSTMGNKYSLKADYYRQLGVQASAGCVRMTVADAKWIYENANNGTTIIIYDSSNPGPFDKPAASQPAYRNGYGWYDPTDPAL